MLAIQTRNLTKTFNSIIALRDLNLEVKKGEIFGLVGPDASGKTTTLRLLCGILPPDRGEVKILGFDVRKNGDWIKEKVGYLPQKFSLYSDLTVIENINFFSDLYKIPKRAREERIDKLLKVANLYQFKRVKSQDLSGGMKQKLGLICALVHKPDILLLDEPTNGIDPISRRDFWMILYELLREGVTILFSTTYLDEAERCNRIGMIYKGELLLTDTPPSIKSEVQEAILEIRTENNQKGIKILEEINLFKNIILTGDKIHIFTDNLFRAEEIIKEVMEKKGLRILSFSRIGPSLEDAFVYLIKKKRRD